MRDLACLLTLTLVLSGCSTNAAPPVEEAADESESATESTTAVLEPQTIGSVSPLHRFGDVLLAGQPSPDDFQLLKDEGVRTVINLRREQELTDFDEAALVSELGQQYVSVPWAGPDELTDAVFDRCRELLSTSERPVLLHCGSSNRVGAVWVPWRVLDGGVSFDEALVEAKTMGLRTAAYEEKARDYVERNQ